MVEDIEARFVVAMFHVLDRDLSHFDSEVQNRIGCKLEFLDPKAKTL